VRSTVDLFTGPDLTLSEVTCRDDHTRWSSPEAPYSRHVLVLARRGRFRRRGREGITDVDPHIGYLTEPGADECFAHPHGGDLCTAIGVGPDLWAGLPSEPSHRSTVYVDARMELLHRRVIAAARAGDPDYALVEGLLALLAQALRQRNERPTRAPSPADRALAASAREAIASAHPAASGLLPLAELLHASPYRLSRAFAHEFGVSVTRYRNRVRVGTALQRLAEGERDIAVLAAELGFADQSHLCRTIRQHVGETPTALRAAFRTAPAPSDG
jgi:AraC-like DNA-binding protein